MTNPHPLPVAVVVNDDATQLNLLAALLKKSGFDARAFSSAEAALAAMVSADPPDLVVTDLYMPGLDGWRFCRLLRSPEYGAYNEVPILVVSATFAGDQTERMAEEIGADAFMPSPVDGREFAAQARALLEGKGTHRLTRVLIVEDSKTLAGLLQKTFAAHGCRADCVHSFFDAEAAFAALPYDVAVLDYHLPDGKGDELLDAFRVRRPDCVCLMMTADTTPELVLDWMKRGSAAYLRKPFDPEVLIELCARARRERALLRVQDLLELRTQELQESTRRYRELFESSRDGFVVWDAQGRILDANAAYCEMLGHSLIELKAKEGFYAVTPARWREWEQEEIWNNRLLKTGASGVYEKEYIRKNGDIFPVELQAFTVKDEHGRIRHLWGIARDITERKRAEKGLRLQALVLDQIQDHVTVTDLEGTITYVNRAEELSMGRPKEEIVGRTTAIYGEDPDRGATQREILETTLRAGSWRGEVVNRSAAGREIVMDCRTLAVRDAEGTPVALAGISTDITERKREEEQRQRLQERLAQAEKLDSIGRLAGGLAHDFNNMLGLILGHAEMALDAVAPGAPGHADVQGIHDAARRSVGLTRQLLAFARKQVIRPRVLDLNDAVCGTLAMLRRLIAPPVVLNWRPMPHPARVLMDPAQLDQLLVNLCINARDAIGKAGTITLQTDVVALDEAACDGQEGIRPGGYVRLSLSDTGCGMDAETLSHLFEPFYTTKEAGKGTGLGLASIYGIVRQNHGRITVESVVGQGTVFHVDLPRQAGMPEPEAIRDTPGASTRGGETILLVEDDLAILQMTRSMLERLGYVVLAAHGWGEALRMVEACTRPIDLLLTDVMMPGMNGFELAQVLRGPCSGIKRLFITGYAADLLSRQESFEPGVALLFKPFTQQILSERIREVLDSGPEPLCKIRDGVKENADR